MKIKEVKFIKAATKIKDCPLPDKPEFAFIGRSNVGKSSLINMLANNKSLALTSSKPGKTKTINHFLVNNKWYLVDLPGYGFAKVSKDQKNQLQQIINDYIFKRENLLNLFVLIDVRIPPQKIDINFINNLGTYGVPFSIVFTKSDKLSKNQLQKNISLFNKELSKFWEELPNYFITSAITGLGRNEILNFIDDVIKNYWKPPKLFLTKH